MFNLIMIILPFIFSYHILGENASNLTLFIIAILFLFLKSNESVALNKSFLRWSILFVGLAFIITCWINPALYSFSGLSIYLNLVVYYISYCHIFSSREKYEFYFKYLLIAMTITSSYYLLSEGMLYGVRVRGNFGYSNTYALFLFLSLILNQVLPLKYNQIINLILITTLFATGSRLTLAVAFVSFLILIFKTKNYMQLIITLIFSLLSYGLISQLGIRSLFFIPVLVFIMKQAKRWHYWFISGLGLLFFIGTNTYERLLNFSIKNASFLERMVSFKDAIQAIKQHLFGQGIQSYEFSHFMYDTAFYDPKYLHNSVLQVMYDIGIIGGILFLIVMFSAYRSVIKSNILVKIALFSIFVHSLMDFDIAFSATFIVIALLVSLNGQEIVSPVSSFVKFLLIPSVYLLVYELLLGTVTATQFPITDYRANLLLAAKFMTSSDWDQALQQLELAYEKEISHPNVIWNLAYVHEKLGNVEQALDYRLKSVKLQPYHQDAYLEYYRLLLEQYDKTKDLNYLNKQQELVTIYQQAIANQNSKASYLPNQLSLTFD